MYDPGKELSRERFFRAIEKSEKKIEPFRARRVELIEEYVGERYGESNGRLATRRSLMINLLHQTAETYTLAFAYNRPRYRIDSPFRELKPFRHHFQRALNNLVKEIHLEEVFRSCILDAFFSWGCCKTYPASSGYQEIADDIWVDVGTPFAAKISLDDWVHDTAVNKFSKIRFAGDSYRVSFESLKDDRFDQAIAKKLQPTSKFEANSNQDRADEIAHGRDTDDDELEPMIDLADFWIPEHQEIHTYAKGAGNRWRHDLKPLAVTPWEGPENGPYHALMFTEVPDSVMPSPPASHLYNLHRLANHLFRKLERQARRFKELNFYTPASAKEAENLQRRSDGDWVKVQDANQFNQVTSGGPNALLNQFAMQTIDLHDRAAGNLKTWAGLGSQADTLGQEQMMGSAINSRAGKIQSAVHRFAEGVGRSLGWMMWVDENLVVPGEIAVDNVSTPSNWTPEFREGDFFEYNFDVEPESMNYKSSEQKLNELRSVVQELAGYGELLYQQGGMIDFQALIEEYSELLANPRIKDLIKFQNPPMDQGSRPGPHGQPPGQNLPQFSRREYVRRSTATADGQSTALQQHLIGLAGSGPDGQPKQGA